MRSLRRVVIGAVTTAAVLALSAAPVAAVGLALAADAAATVSPGTLDFGGVDLGAVSAAKTVTVTSTGTSALTLGQPALTGTNASQFKITADTCANQVLAPGGTCTVSVSVAPAAAGSLAADLVLPDDSAAGQETVPLSVTGVDGSLGTFAAIAPVRVLDTRNGNGGYHGPITAGGVVSIQIDGRGYQPTGHVSAVVLNVTETGATSAGFLTAYPGGAPRPTASNLNFVAGDTRANSVTVQVGANGKVDIYTSAKSVQIIADLSGYFVGDDAVGAQGELQTVRTQRILDTRSPGLGPLPGGSYVEIPISYGAVDPHIRAVAVNVTAVGATNPGFLTAWDGSSALPPTSTVNYVQGSVTPNFAIVPTSICPATDCGVGSTLPIIGIYNGAPVVGRTHVVVDIVGFFDDGSLGGGLRFHPMAPRRLVDTRTNLGARALGAGGTAKIAAASVSGSQTGGLALNVTAVAPSANTYLTIWPSDETRPTASTLNPAAHQIVANAAITLLSPDCHVNVFNAYGTTNFVIDVAGTYDYYPYGGGAATIRSLQPGTAAVPTHVHQLR